MPLSKQGNDSAKSRQWRIPGGSQLAGDNDRSHVHHVIGLQRNVYVRISLAGRPTYGSRRRRQDLQFGGSRRHRARNAEGIEREGMGRGFPLSSWLGDLVECHMLPQWGPRGRAPVENDFNAFSSW